MPHRFSRRPLWMLAAGGALVLTGCGRSGDANNMAAPANAAAPATAGTAATEYDVVRAMLNMADVKPDDLVMDLGSGDGRIPILAAREKGARGVGIELDPQLIRQANANATRDGVGTKVVFRQQDLFVTALNDATVLTLYLLPEINLQLRPKILAQMRPGTRVVSNSFDMGDWRPDRTEKVGSTTIYMWTVPAQVAGRYSFQLEGGQGTLTLEQRYQDLSGSANLGEGERPIGEARLQGADIQFQVDGRTYRGRVSGNLIEGQDWRAAKAG
jgi:SAM-dependent methyltransferase